MKTLALGFAALLLSGAAALAQPVAPACSSSAFRRRI
jgi:hypothetical protein